MNGSSKDSSSISRFFLPAKRKRPDSTNKQNNYNDLPKQRNVNQDNVIDLIDDDDDDDESFADKYAENCTGQSKDSLAVKENHQASEASQTVNQEGDLNHGELQITIADGSPHTTTTTVTTSPSTSEQGESDVTTVEIVDPPKSENDAPKNPFAQFAFNASATAAANQNPISLTSWTKSKPIVKQTGLRPNTGVKTAKSKPQTFKAGKTDWIRMKDIAADEQERIVKKWHSLADPSASLEDRRFQILVAARIHARCQDGPVRKAMKELRNFFQDNSSSGTLSVESMAAISDPENMLVPSIRNLQYHNTKAKHLVQAAQEIKSRFRGQVPEEEHSLKEITGIGPVLADLLAFVNTRAKHQEAIIE